MSLVHMLCELHNAEDPGIVMNGGLPPVSISNVTSLLCLCSEQTGVKDWSRGDILANKLFSGNKYTVPVSV